MSKCSQVYPQIILIVFFKEYSSIYQPNMYLQQVKCLCYYHGLDVHHISMYTERDIKQAKYASLQILAATCKKCEMQRRSAAVCPDRSGLHGGSVEVDLLPMSICGVLSKLMKTN